MKKQISILLFIVIILGVLCYTQKDELEGFAAKVFNINSGNPAETVVINNDFSKSTLDLSLKLFPFMPGDKNYMISPLSIKLALAMTANGADGETKKQMLDTIGITDLPAYNAYADKLITKYKSLGAFISNSIWLNESEFDKGVDFTDDFKKNVSSYYHGKAGCVNNSNAVSTINRWITNKTHGDIKNALSNDDNKFCSYIVNSVYFKGKWDKKFDKNNTFKQDFTDKNGKVEQIEFMHDKAQYEYFEDDKAQVVAKPYGNKNIEMCFLLPKEASFNTDDLSKIMNGIDYKLEDTKVTLSVPKFKTSFRIDDMKDIFTKLGMVKAFSDGAEFKNLYNPAYNSKIEKIIHQTYLSVDEGKTEAAAATVVRNTIGIEYVSTAEMTLDHPFYYFIRDKSNGEILFMGEYAYAD